MKIVLTPDWFIGKDLIIDAFSFIVLFLYSILAVKNYKLSRNRALLYLGVGFALIAIGQAATVFTKLVLYYNIGPSQAIGQAIVNSNLLNSVDIFYYLGFFSFRILTLVGFYIIYRLPRKNKSAWDYVVAAYFVLVSALLTQSMYYLFHLTALILLLLIVGKYYGVLQKYGLTNTKILIAAFAVLAFGQMVFMLSTIDSLFVVANFIELMAYSILLGLGIRLTQNGKETKPNGYNIRHVGYNPGKKRKH